MSASATPEAPTGSSEPSESKPKQFLESCWSCRLLTGGGLILSGAYVFNAARRVMKQGGMTSIGTVAQITFAGCLAAWGVVIITDPVKKNPVKTVEKPH